MSWNDFRKHVSKFPQQDVDRIQRAYEIAEKAHEKQTRKSGEAYFTHPIAVSEMLIDMGADATTIISTLLHDVVEDTDVSLSTIKEEFGSEVSNLVDGVTKLSKEHLENKPTLDEKIETLRKIFSLMQNDIRIMVIKLADRLHNIRTSQYLPPERKEKLAKETMDVYVKIAEKLGMREISDTLEEGCREIQNPQLLEKLRQQQHENEKLGIKVVRQMKSELSKHFAPFADSLEIEYERKKWRELEAQVAAGSAATGIFNIIVSVTCKNPEDCYRALGALHRLWQRETLSFQDYINAPMLNGYEGIHTTIILPTGERIRCKIRTADMKEFAFKGITERCFKQNHVSGVLPLTQHISSLTEETRDRSKEFWEAMQSDILGETMIVHGTDDSTAIIPGNSTALDGAFFLFGDETLKAKKIMVNGQEVPFFKKLEFADSIALENGKGKTVVTQWLSWVSSGFAAAKIRRALRMQNQNTKIEAGKILLQEQMASRRGGFLEEFNESRLEKSLRSIGYASFSDALVALAEGKIGVHELYDALFEHKNKNQKPTTYRISCIARSEQIDEIFEILKEEKAVRSFAFSYPKDGDQQHMKVNAKIQCSPENVQNVLAHLQTIGIQKIRNESKKQKWIRILLCTSILFLWGADPVFAKKILELGITPIDFTLIRMVSVFGTSSILMIVSGMFQKHSLISLKTPSLWIAGLCMFGISYYTYSYLADGSPTLYNTILRGNALLIAFTEIVRRKSIRMLVWSTAIMLLGYALIVAQEGISQQLLMAFGVLLLFYIYTLASTHFQKQFKIIARYPQFFFVTSAIALAASSSLFFTDTETMTAPVGIILGASVYSVVFIGIPYIIFYWLTKNYGYALISPWITSSLAITFITQWILYGTSGMLFLIPAAILLIYGSMLSSIHLRQEKVT